MTVEKKRKQSVFQVLLLDNNKTQDVEVQEAEQVDFSQVKAHLNGGGSVFITSKNSQKIKKTPALAVANFSRSRRTVGFLYKQHLRDQ
ncbi:MAG: hypothetical protein M1540_00080 [Candidatus Bathyarchaeota archaeon]|nr:hypothetical protein [Candidatus Bathyarchaeota archaeon]